MDLLITPIQRITKYSLFLRDIRDCTSDAQDQAEIDATLLNVERSMGEYTMYGGALRGALLSWVSNVNSQMKCD